MGPVKQSKTLLTDGQTEIINLIVGLVTRNPPNDIHVFKKKYLYDIILVLSVRTLLRRVNVHKKQVQEVNPGPSDH